MKKKFKYVCYGLNDALCTSGAFITGMLFTFSSFFADKAWHAIVVFILGVILTAGGVASAYINGKNEERRKELEEKDFEAWSLKYFYDMNKKEEINNDPSTIVSDEDD